MHTYDRELNLKCQHQNQYFNPLEVRKVSIIINLSDFGIILLIIEILTKLTEFQVKISLQKTFDQQICIMWKNSFDLFMNIQNVR